MTEQDHGTSSSRGRFQESATGEQLAERLWSEQATVGAEIATYYGAGEGEVIHSAEIGKRLAVIEGELMAVHKVLNQLLVLIREQSEDDIGAKAESLFTMIASEEVLSKEWLTPEEEEAWEDL